MAQFLQRFQELWKILGLNQKVSLFLALGFLVIGLGGIFFWASRPQMELLFGRIDQSDMAEVARLLDEDKVPYELRGGSSIYVRAADVHRLRLKLAEQGLPQGGENGYELFDRPSLGFSEFMQKTNYVRALQGELSRTIVQMDKIRSARVMVVLPKERLFLNGEPKAATASVFIETGGSELPLHSVNAIRFLVANAVEGVEPDQVAVVDNRGRVLTEALTEDSSMPGMNGRWRARRDLENYFRSQIETLLIPTSGTSGVIARVAVELNQQGFTRRERSFDPDVAVVRSQTTTEDSSASNEARPGSAVSVTNEITENTPNAVPVTTSQDTRKVRTTHYEINEETVETHLAPGGIKSISAAVMLAQRVDPATGALIDRSPAEIDRLREIVANAIGIRGQPDWADFITVAEMPFDSQVVSPEIPALPWYAWFLQNQRLVLQVAALVLATMIFLWFVKLLKRTRMEMSGLQPVDEVAPTAVNVTPRVTPEMLNELVEKKADNVSAALQNWVREENASKP